MSRFIRILCQILVPDSVLCRNEAINHAANRFGVAKHRWAKTIRLRNNIHHCSRNSYSYSHSQSQSQSQ